MKIDWAFVDLDGTLLNIWKKVPLRNLKALKKYVGTGGKVVIATGSWPISARIFNKKIEKFTNQKNPYLIALNGAYIYDNLNEQLLVTHAINQTVFTKLLEIQEKYKIASLVYTKAGLEKKTVFCNYTNIHHFVFNFNFGYLKSFQKCDWQNDQVLKLVFFSLNNKKIEALLYELKNTFYNVINIVQPNRKIIEITDQMADKGQAVQLLAQKANFNMANTAGLGNSENDFTLLQNTGVRINFNYKKHNVARVANYNYYSNKMFAYALENNITAKNLGANLSYLKSDLTPLKIAFDFIPYKCYPVNITKKRALWDYLVKQQKIYLETKLPFWLTKHIYQDFLINQNLRLITNQKTLFVKNNGQKTYYCKPLTDKQLELVTNALVNDKKPKVLIFETAFGKPFLYYNNSETLQSFWEQFQFTANLFHSVDFVQNYELSQLRNQCLSVTVFNNYNYDLNDYFLVHTHDDLYFLNNYPALHFYEDFFTHNKTKNFTISKISEWDQTIGAVEYYLQTGA